jgi:putative transposase
VKRRLVVEAMGGPLGATIAGANVHDTKLLAATLEVIVVEGPRPTDERPQHLCVDKGYDNPSGHETVATSQYTPHQQFLRFAATGLCPAVDATPGTPYG